MLTRNSPIGWARQNAMPLYFNAKPSEPPFSAVFSNFDKCSAEVAGDVSSGVALDQVDMERRACKIW